MSKNNLVRYNRLSKVPKEALKPIDFGALKGKHSINPMWRIKAMTDEYGPYGEGWEVDYDYDFRGAGAYEMVIVKTFVRAKVDDQWTPAARGVGTAMLTNKNGVDDDAIKKALSDSLSVAFKFFGVGGDVYMDIVDGDKYLERQPQPSAGPKDQVDEPSKKALSNDIQALNSLKKSLRACSDTAAREQFTNDNKPILDGLAEGMRNNYFNLKADLDAEDMEAA
jgi:hypothetical protein